MCKANEVLSFIVWDMASTSARCPLEPELAAYPLTYKAAHDPRFGAASNMEGRWEMLWRVGCFLQEADAVRFLICDRATSHEWVWRLLLGLGVPLESSVLAQVPFFPRLQYKRLPSSCLRLEQYQVAYVDGVSIHYIPGVAHTHKAITAGLRSSIRTVRLGGRWSGLLRRAGVGALHGGFCGCRLDE